MDYDRIPKSKPSSRVARGPELAGIPVDSHVQPSILNDPHSLQIERRATAETASHPNGPLETRMNRGRDIPTLSSSNEPTRSEFECDSPAGHPRGIQLVGRDGSAEGREKASDLV